MGDSCEYRGVTIAVGDIQVASCRCENLQILSGKDNKGGSIEGLDIFTNRSLTARPEADKVFSSPSQCFPVTNQHIPHVFIDGVIQKTFSYPKA